jgi:hypothetical protein
MMPVGQTTQLVHEIRPAGEIVTSMVAEAEEILSRLSHGVQR